VKRVLHARRTLTDEERDYLGARQSHPGRREAPPHQQLILGVLGSALAAGGVYALTCGHGLWLALFVFVVGTAVMAVRHIQRRRAVAGDRSRWDPPEDTTWQVDEWRLQPSAAAEVGDDERAGDDWLLFRVTYDRAFLVALLDLNFDAVEPAPSLQALATEHLVLRWLVPDGPMLPALPSGDPIPVHSFRVEGRTWSPPQRRDADSLQIGLDQLPDWLRAVL